MLLLLLLLQCKPLLATIAVSGVVLARQEQRDRGQGLQGAALGLY